MKRFRRKWLFGVHYAQEIPKKTAAGLFQVAYVSGNILLFVRQSMVKAVLFAAFWLGVTVMVLRDPRPSRRSKEAVYVGIAVMLVLPAVCALLLGHSIWGAAGFAEAVACLLVLKYAHAEGLK